MKAPLTILALGGAFTVLMACAPNTEHREPAAFSQTGPDAGIYVVVDTATGCEYLRDSWKGGLTPRFAADGQIICKAPK